MVLYFKVDNKGDLWLLWSSSIRIGPNPNTVVSNPSAAVSSNKPLNLSPKFTLPSPSDTGADKIDNNIDIETSGNTLTVPNPNSSMRNSHSLKNSLENSLTSPKKNSTPREPGTEGHDDNTNGDDDEEKEEKVEPELESQKEELGESLDDLLYEAYSHFLQGSNEPFVFKMPEPFSAAFADDKQLFKEIISKLHIEEDSTNVGSYKLGKKSGTVSTNKMQHEFAEFKDMVLEEFVVHWHEKKKPSDGT
jgi:hypothetical protein